MATVVTGFVAKADAATGLAAAAVWDLDPFEYEFPLPPVEQPARTTRSVVMEPEVM